MVLLALGVVLARGSTSTNAFGVNASGGLGPLPGRVAPSAKLPLLDGSTLSFDELRGQGVVVNFWASWCVPCRDEAPLLARVARDYQSQSITFIGVNEWDTESDARAFMEKYQVGYRNGIDPGGRIAIELGVTGLPETYFIRADGSYSRRWVGPLSEERLRSLVEELRS